MNFLIYQKIYLLIYLVPSLREGKTMQKIFPDLSE